MLIIALWSNQSIKHYMSAVESCLCDEMRKLQPWHKRRWSRDQDDVCIFLLDWLHILGPSCLSETILERSWCGTELAPALAQCLWKNSTHVLIVWSGSERTVGHSFVCCREKSQQSSWPLQTLGHTLPSSTQTPFCCWILAEIPKSRPDQVKVPECLKTH